MCNVCDKEDAAAVDVEDVMAEQSPEAAEFERQLALPILERHENGYWISDHDKISFLFEVAVKADKALSEIMPQVEPLLNGIAKNPMLKMFMKS